NSQIPVIGASLAIYDLSGREVMTHILQGKLTSIQRGNMDTGIYLYKVRDNTGNVIGQGKLVIAD
ncbi:MAG TPA: T9SS type A sorting domain-containing protein, partial [Bacteroidia bacterium]|nr:T9SS type A sorting domain-containing protein [Bacteroidia bacterium]